MVGKLMRPCDLPDTRDFCAGRSNGISAGQRNRAHAAATAAAPLLQRTCRGVIMAATDVRSDWWSLAACQSADPELFFPISSLGAGSHEVARAKAVCRQCQVRSQCLSHALASRQVQGIWGGTTEEERQLLRERGQAQKASAA
jgi:WhiB family redox-sensing transcriptional regulator